MTRMIDADALNKKLCETTTFIKDGEKFQRMINDAPTIEPDGDLVSRQDAINAFYEPKNGGTYAELDDGSEWYMTSKQIYAVLDSLPSAPSTEAEQVTGKLNNPDGSLLTADSEACKEQKSKLDLISRQDAIAEFRDGRDVYDIMESIEELPSAPDSRKRGEWVRKYDGHINCYWYECDQCGEYRPRNQFGHEYNANFCPNCGARMKGGAE